MRLPVFSLIWLCALLAAPSVAFSTGPHTAPAFQRFLPEHVQMEKTLSAAPQGYRFFKELEADLPVYQRCIAVRAFCPTERLKVWSDFVRAIEAKPQNIQAAYVNGWFNRLPYREDDWIYGKDDHWASFEQFLQYSGDCEDFSAAKYLTLKLLGFSEDQLKITIVYDVYSGTDHAFLVARIGMNDFILDNRVAAMEPVRFIDRYQPYYAFNETGLFVYDKPLVASRVRGDDPQVLPGNR